MIAQLCHRQGAMRRVSRAAGWNLSRKDGSLRSSRNLLRPIMVALGVGLAAALAGPAGACSYTHAPDPVGDSSARFIGGRMLDAASYVDLAIAERSDTVRGPDGAELPGKAITFRVLRRLKGSSPDRFILFGTGIMPIDPAAKAWDLGHWVDEAGRVEPFGGVREVPVQGRTLLSSCDPPDLRPALGRTYLVFREVNGRLLGPLVFHPGGRATEAFPIADVGLFAGSSWARQVYHSAPPRPNQASTIGRSDGAPDDLHGVVAFRTPVSAEAAEALARTAGAMPVSVTVAIGKSTAAYGLGSGFASLKLFEQASLWAGRLSTPPEALRELARQLATTYTAYDFETDGAKIANARDLLTISAPQDQRTAAISGFVFRGGADVRRALQASAQVQSVAPAVRVRERVGVSVAPLPPEETSAFPVAIGAAELHRSLSRLAGVSVSDATIAGTWRLASVDTLPVESGTLTFRLEGGRISGTLACSSFEGSYDLRGSVILFSTPKPPVVGCAKAETTWLGEGFFENPAATIRSTGAELVLSRGNASYKFVRID